MKKKDCEMIEKEMKAGVCRVCGCTEQNPCWNPVAGNCWWADDTHTICSHCADECIATDPDTVHCLEDKRDAPVLETPEDEYARLYDIILSGWEDWDSFHLERLLELHLLLNKNRESYEERSENPHH